MGLEAEIQKTLRGIQQSLETADSGSATITALERAVQDLLHVVARLAREIDDLKVSPPA